MRDIKFRAWDSENKWMDNHFWVYSDGRAYDIPDKTYNTPHTEIEQKNNLIIMQYTGLKDCNGVEIYEGHVINDAFLVGFDNGGYVLYNISNGDIILNLTKENIHEHKFEITGEYAELEKD